jgi:hypothetical protein
MTNINLTNLIERLAAVQWKAAAQALLQHDPSTWIERSIRTLAIAIAFIYTAGWSIGHGVHRANTWLSQLSSALVMHKTHNHDPQPALPCTDALQVAPVPVAPVPVAPVPVAPVPVAPKTRARRKAQGITQRPAASAAPKTPRPRRLP